MASPKERQSDAQWEKSALEALNGFDVLLGRAWGDGTRVVGASLAPPRTSGEEWRLVLKVQTDTQRLVAFFYSETLVGVLAKTVRECRDGKARYKVDEWAR